MKTSGTAYLAIKQSHCHAFHRFPSLSYLFSRSKSEAVKAEVTSVVWLEKPWLEVNLGERVETADDSRDQEICIARAVQDVELKGVDRLNMFEQDA